MGNLTSSYKRLPIQKPAPNVKRIYELSSDVINILTHYFLSKPYTVTIEYTVIHFLEVFFLQLKTVYISEHPVYDNFIPSPPYQPKTETSDEPEIPFEKRREAYKQYVLESVRYINQFCNDYSELFPSN